MSQNTDTRAVMPIRRRTVLKAGAAAAILAAAGPLRAQEGEPTVVLITGTSSGFGRLMAETFARKGFRVLATMREVEGRNRPAAEELRSMARAENLSLDVFELDVLSGESVAAA